MKDSMNLDLRAIGSAKDGEVGFAKFFKHMRNFSDDITNVFR